MNGTRPHPDSLYFHVASDAFERAKQASTALDGAKALLASNPSAYAQLRGLPPIDHATFNLKIAVVTVMTFSAMCLEAYINSCYATLFPNEFSLMERRSPESKWTDLPLRLEINQTFDRAVEPYSTFADLIWNRNNRLMHFKLPQEMIGSGSSSKQTYSPYFGDLVEDIALAEKYLNCVGAMIRELHRLTNRQTAIPPFLSGSKYMSMVTSTFSMPFENT